MDEKEMDKLIDKMKDIFVVKADITGFATKKDLENFASKEDIAGIRQEMATKKDLENFATKKDLEKFATSEDHVNLEEKVDNITEILNSIKEDVSALKVHLYDTPARIGSLVFEKEHSQIKEVIEEKLGVRIGV